MSSTFNPAAKPFSPKGISTTASSVPPPAQEAEGSPSTASSPGRSEGGSTGEGTGRNVAAAPWTPGWAKQQPQQQQQPVAQPQPPMMPNYQQPQSQYPPQGSPQGSPQGQQWQGQYPPGPQSYPPPHMGHHHSHHHHHHHHHQQQHQQYQPPQQQFNGPMPGGYGGQMPPPPQQQRGYPSQQQPQYPPPPQQYPPQQQQPQQYPSMMPPPPQQQQQYPPMMPPPPPPQQQQQYMPPPPGPSGYPGAYGQNPSAPMVYQQQQQQQYPPQQPPPPPPPQQQAFFSQPPSAQQAYQPSQRQLHQQQQQQQQASFADQQPAVPAPPPAPVASPLSPMNPIVVLVVGVRGSGKSTQSKRIAERYNLLHASSGDIARAGKEPLVELASQLTTYFGRESSRQVYNGVVLDRFIASSPMDVYYLSHVLDSFKLKINAVINLAVPPEVGTLRAHERDGEAGKPVSDQRRLQEQLVLRDVNKSIFSASGVLHSIADGTPDAVFDAINVGIEDMLKTPMRPAVTLPRQTLEDGTPMVTDYSLFKEVRAALHDAVGTPPSKVEAFPGSQIVGQMTQKTWQDFFKHLPSYYVTLKADGKRVLMVRWRNRVFVFPGKFTCMYELPERSIPGVLLNNVTTPSAKEIYFIFDVEFVISTKTNKWSYYLFDYLFLGGRKGSSVRFSERYAAIKKLLDEHAGFTTMYVKEFVPVNQLTSILPALDAPNLPFAIDGLVFQHDGMYRVPQDKAIFKWKPQSMCSVDFRLCHPRCVEEGEEGSSTWEFELACLSTATVGTRDEKPYPGAFLVADNVEIAKLGLVAGAVVEAVKVIPKHNKSHQSNNNNGQPQRTEWKLLRVRTDKLFPNQEEIAIYLDKMEHWSFEDLKKACAGTKSIAAPLIQPAPLQ